MKKSKTTPHDTFFKALLEDIQRARIFLSRLLPGELTGHFDMETLNRENTSFISETLKATFSDGLFTVRLKENEDEEALVAILLEHKSYPDKWVSLQMLAYLADGYRMQADKIKSRKAGDSGPRHLRPIIPFLFYHGKHKWSFRTLQELLGKEYGPFLNYVPTFSPVYTSLPEMPDEEISGLGEGWLKAALMTQKYSHDSNELQKKLVSILRNLYKNVEGNFLQIWSVYFSSAISIEPSVFYNIIENLPSDINPDVMISLYDQLIEKGRKEGLEKGLEQGLEKGLEQGLEKGLEQGLELGIEKGLKEGLQLGLQEGWKEGHEIAKRETILMGYQNGISIEVLCLVTGYSEDQVREIILKGN